MRYANRVFLLALLLVSTPAVSATDINFSFNDGSTVEFYGRTHVPGTVTGILHGLLDTGTSAPTSIEVTSAPAGIQFVNGDYTGNSYSTPGFTTLNGNVLAASYFFNFIDSANNSFQMRFSCTDPLNCGVDTGGLNLLFWNGGNTPIAGTGNQLGFSGVTYGPVSGAVPEPATWAMMLMGFAGMGLSMRRRRRVGVAQIA